MKKVILATVFMLFGCESAQMQSFNKAMFGDLGNSISYQNNNAINNVQHQDDVDYFYKMVVSNDTIEALTATTTIRGYWLWLYKCDSYICKFSNI